MTPEERKAQFQNYINHALEQFWPILAELPASVTVEEVNDHFMLELYDVTGDRSRP